MRRIQVAEGIIRVLLSPEDCHPFNPVSFHDSSGEYLSQTGCVFTPRPVFRLSVDGVQGEVRQTANGEVISFDSGECRQVGSVWSAVLRFSFPGSPVLTGLGAHEDGIFDYSGKSELLYEHNMKIPIPFLLSSDGWGLLLEAGCSVISNREAVLPGDTRRALSLGTYRMCPDGQLQPLAMPRWAWGKLYEKIVRSVLSGAWDTAAKTEAVNYWWGMDSGALDVELSEQLPEGVRAHSMPNQSCPPVPFRGPFSNSSASPPTLAKSRKLAIWSWLWW